MEDLKQVNVVLSNEFQTFATDSEGNYTSPLNLSTTINVYFASEDVTSSDDCTISAESSEGLTATYYEGSHTAVVTDLSTDEGYILFTVQYKNFIVTKKFTVAKLKQGLTGKSIMSITEYFAASSSNTEPPSSWSINVPTLTPTNKYLWNYERIVYSDSTFTELKKRVIGMFSEDGADGVSITDISNFYLVTSASSGVTTETPGWTTIPGTTTSENRYLWNYEVITYSDESSTTSTPHIISVQGKDGFSPLSAVLDNEYQSVSVSSDGTFTLDNIQSTVTVYSGFTNITNLCSITTSETGLQGVLLGSTYVVTALNEDQGEVTFSIEYEDTILTKIFHVSKVYNG